MLLSVWRTHGVCQQPLAERTQTGKVDVDDLTPAGRSRNEIYLTGTKPQVGGDDPFDGRVRLALDRAGAHPHVQRIVSKLDALAARARMGNNRHAKH
jgi:hypothetical protein